ncbi:MAG: hypothetical protein FJ146_11170 [Deltaproteobacteria bacterium]|nr:hypothetical protein [Deltaproteobacteria bacterium]
MVLRRFLHLNIAKPGRTRHRSTVVSLVFVSAMAASCGSFNKSSSESPNQGGVLGLNGKTTCQVRPYRASTLLALTDAADHLGTLVPRDVVETLEERLPPGISTRVAASYQARAEIDSGHVPIEFVSDTYPLCSSQFHATIHWGDGDTRIKGRIPKGPQIASAPMPNLDQNRLRVQIMSGLKANAVNGAGELTLGQVEQCWYSVGNKLNPAAEVNFSVGGIPYQALVQGDSVLELGAQMLHASAKIFTYRQNARQPIEEIVVEGMQPSGFLCNDYLIADTDGVQKAYSNQGVFQFPKTDDRFFESTLFVHANDMMQWFLGYDKSAHWSQTQVELRRTFDATQRASGPVYMNPSSNSGAGGPVILVPDVLQIAGGPPILENLTTDFDVIAHELSHHIVTRYLPIPKATERDLIAVHEGLADFFVFAKTGDACLGETICTDSGGTQCTVENTCLRSGEIKYVNDESKSKEPAHRKSQALSGMLWDLTRSTSLGRSGMVKLVMATLKYLDRGTNFDDVYSELINVDRKLNKGNNVCAIHAAAVDHGIGVGLNSTECP